MASSILLVLLAGFIGLVISFEVDVQNNLIIPNASVDQDDSTPPIFECGEDSDVTNPGSCESFIKCSHHLKYVIPCQIGFHFNNETGNCSLPCDAHCDQRIACYCGWTTCMSGCQEPNGIYSHPDDCEKYVKCTDGKALVLKCSQGEAFDSSTKKCIAKHRTECK